MSIESSGKPHPEDESSAQLAEGIVWLPRAPLRSARRGGGLLTGLTILTAGVLATAAGVAALARHTDLATFDLAALQIFSADEKAADRAPAAQPAASFRAAAPTVTPSPATPDPEPVDIASEKIALDGPASVATTPASSRVSELMPDPERIVPSPEMFKTPAPFYDPLPPIPSSSAPPLPPLAPSETPPAYAPIARSAPTAPTDAGRPAPARVPERQTAALAPAQSAPAAREAARPAPAGGKVAIYLDAFEDQKGAAAALSQKQGKYAPLIGSAGKLTYSRRGGDAWRLRVTNLDQATAEAVCAKLKGAGAPCTVGPN